MKTMNETLKASHLMIGDWVKWEYVSYPDVVVNNGYKKVDAIYGDESVDLIDEDTLYVHVPMYDIKVVELTAEILEKNKFERHRIFDGGLMEENWKFSSDYYDITVYEWSDSIWVYRYECTEMNMPHEQIVISHVNELQHALKMCGIKKQIIL